MADMDQRVEEANTTKDIPSSCAYSNRNVSDLGLERDTACLRGYSEQANARTAPRIFHNNYFQIFSYLQIILQHTLNHLSYSPPRKVN